MFDSTNYPYNVQYTVKPENKPVVNLSAWTPTLHDYHIMSAELAEQDREQYFSDKRQAELSQLDGLWAEVLAS